MSGPRPLTSSPEPNPPTGEVSGRGIPLPGMRWRGFTLQMFLFTVLPLTVLLIGIVFASLSLHHATMRTLAGDRDLRAVRAAASSLSHEIQHLGVTLQLLAMQVEGDSLAVSPLRETGFEEGFALFTPAGELLDSAGPAAAVWQRWANLLPAPGEDGAAFSAPVQGADGRWLVLVTARTPDDRWLAGAFSPARMLGPALTTLTSPGQSRLVVVGPGGELLYQSGDFGGEADVLHHAGVQAVLRGDSGVNYTGGTEHSLVHETGEEHVVAFAPIAPLGWGLALEEDWEDIASPLLQTTQYTPLLLVPILLLAVLALWFGARQIIQPLQALERRAAALAAGDFAAIQRPVGGIAEIRHLQDELARMAEALRAAQHSLHGYIGALTAGVENERRALARELHDDTLQALIALNQRVQYAQMNVSDPQQRQQLAELQERVNQTITNLRQAIGGLRPIYLEDLGLAAALGMLVRETEKSANFLVQFDASGTERRLPPDVELALYRITQEALSNAARHAHPDRVTVSLRFGQGQQPLELTITDNGKGFTPPDDPNAFARQGHFGLLGMKERADLIGARLEIDSREGKGTQVQITLSPD